MSAAPLSAHAQRRRAQDRASGPAAGTISLSALRVPKAARQPLQQLLALLPTLPAGLDDIASHHWPTRALMESIAADLVILADALPLNPPDSATSRALQALAQATTTISTAYQRRAREAGHD